MERKLNEDVGEIFLRFLRIYWRLCEQIVSVGEYKMLNIVSLIITNGMFDGVMNVSVRCC